MEFQPARQNGAVVARQIPSRAKVRKKKGHRGQIAEQDDVASSGGSQQTLLSEVTAEG